LCETLGRALAAEPVKVEGECRNARVDAHYVSFDLCGRDSDCPDVVRVWIPANQIWRIRQGLESRWSHPLEECLADGRCVVVIGTAEVRRTSIQVSATGVYINDFDAVGSLQAQLNRLPSTLEDLGIPPDRLSPSETRQKLTLDRPPSRIAVVTGKSSRAYEDFCAAFWSTAKRKGAEKFPRPQLVHVPFRLEGAGVADELVRVLRDEVPESRADAVCIVRGGGPWSDLWPFHSLEVVKAVHDMPMPVFTAIGHESDRLAIDCAARGSRGTPSSLGEGLGWAFRELCSRSVPRVTGIKSPGTRVAGEPTELEEVKRRLAQSRARCRTVEAELSRAQATLEDERARADAAQKHAFEQGLRSGERLATNRAVEVALIVTVLVTFAIGGLAVAVGELVFVIVALAGVVGAARLILEWVRTAPERGARWQRKIREPKEPTVL